MGFIIWSAVAAQEIINQSNEQLGKPVDREAIPQIYAKAAKVLANSGRTLEEVGITSGFQRTSAEKWRA